MLIIVDALFGLLFAEVQIHAPVARIALIAN